VAGVGLYDMRVMVLLPLLLLLRFAGAARMSLGCTTCGSRKRPDRELRLPVAERRRRGMEAILSGESERDSWVFFYNQKFKEDAVV
jgi:hypothetical protein